MEGSKGAVICAEALSSVEDVGGSFWAVCAMGSEGKLPFIGEKFKGEAAKQGLRGYGRDLFEVASVKEKEGGRGLVGELGG